MTRGTPVVLDASALLAVFREEQGHELVSNRIADGGLVSALNWAEVLSRLVDLGGDPHETAAMASPQTASGTIEVVPFGDREARESAKLRARTRSLGLSLADRAALALALARGLPVLTADRAWTSLRLPVKIEVIR